MFYKYFLFFLCLHLHQGLFSGVCQLDFPLISVAGEPKLEFLLQRPRERGDFPTAGSLPPACSACPACPVSPGRPSWTVAVQSLGAPEATEDFLDFVVIIVARQSQLPLPSRPVAPEIYKPIFLDIRKSPI